MSTAAEQILQQGSQPQTSQPSDSASAQPADPPAAGGASWKGQQGAIGDLIHLWISWSPQPCQTVLGLLQGALAQVPSQPLTGKKAQEPVHPYPGTPISPPTACLDIMHDSAASVLPVYCVAAVKVSTLHVQTEVQACNIIIPSLLQLITHCDMKGLQHSSPTCSMPGCTLTVSPSCNQVGILLQAPALLTLAKLNLRNMQSWDEGVLEGMRLRQAQAGLLCKCSMQLMVMQG